MAVVEVQRPGRADAGAQTYEAHNRDVQRIRLTTDESRTITYVFSDWDSEIGLASNFGAMAQAIAAQGQPDTPAQAKRRKLEGGQATAVPKADVHGFDAKSMTPTERWCDRKLSEREKILRCWRALRVMGRARSPSLIILHALYGDMPPGLPARGTWSRDVDLDYRRVVRYVDASGGTGAALDALLLVDRHVHTGESPENAKARYVAAEASKRSLVAELGRAAEQLIARACGDYRVALREQP